MSAMARRLLPLAVLALAAGGCAAMAGPAAYKLVEPPRVSIDAAFTVEPQFAWSATTAGKIESWTIDGFALNAVRFYKGIYDGEPLLPGGIGTEKRPRFQTSMSVTEIAEMVSDTLFAGRVRARNLQPVTFAGAPGFRFESIYVTQAGVDRRALVMGGVLRNKLYVIVYDAVALYYYGRYEAHVVKLFESVRAQ
jgi:hypothetical protein